MRASWRKRRAVRSFASIRTAGKLIVEGVPIEVRPHPVAVVCFGCPRCKGDKYKLYLKDGAWACPTCHGLDRASRHRHWTLRGYWRALQIRRKIAPGTGLFDPLPRKPITVTRYWRAAIELRSIEASLTGLVADNATVIERRSDDTTEASYKPRVVKRSAS